MTRALLLAAVLVASTLTGCGGDEPPDDEPTGLLDTVFVGDSITRGVSQDTFAPDDDYSWVTYALSDSRSPWRLDSNVAQFGRTLGEMRDSFRDEVLVRDPEAVVFMGGTNDALRMLPVDQSVDALRSMVEDAQEAGAQVWIVSPTPLDASYQRPIAPYVEAESALAEELDVPFVDVSTVLAGDDGRWLPGMSSDGVHPTTEGARELANLVLDEFGR